MVEWIAIVYDKEGGDRLGNRAAHLAAIPKNIANGSIVSAGAIFNQVPKEGEKPDFAGSVVNVIADTREEALEILKQDIYCKNGVWNMDNILLYPIGIAARQGKDFGN